MPAPIAGMAVQSQADARVRADEMLAAAQLPSQADLAEFQQVASNLDLLLAARAVDVDGLIDEFARVRNPQRHATK